MRYLNNEVNYRTLYTVYNRYIAKGNGSSTVNILDDYPTILPKTIESGDSEAYLVRIKNGNLVDWDREKFIKYYHGINNELFHALFTPKHIATLKDVWSSILVGIKNNSLSGKLITPLDSFVEDTDERFQEPSIQRIKYFFRKILADTPIVSSGDLMKYFQDNGLILPTTDKVKYALYDHYLNHPDEIELHTSLGARAEYKLRKTVSYFIYHYKTKMGETITVNIDSDNPRNKARYQYSQKSGIAYRDLRGYRIN